ncbi:MAG: hypothetical protein HDT23_05445 [Ruminococcus sp.]|nr:hypothetical protein [Ruminococcus sp.]
MKESKNIMKIICKQCHKEFEITASEIEYFRSKNLNIPKRCKNCREINRRINNPDNYNSAESKIINYKTIIIILCLIIVAILIVAGTAIYVLSPEDNSHTDNSAVMTHTQQTTSTVQTETFTTTEQTTSVKTTKTIKTPEQVTTTQPVIQTAQAEVITYYLNTYRKKFHKPDCDSVTQMNSKNRKAFYGTRDEAIAQGYSPCGNCNP